MFSDVRMHELPLSLRPSVQRVQQALFRAKQNSHNFGTVFFGCRWDPFICAAALIWKGAMQTFGLGQDLLPAKKTNNL